MSAPYRTLIDPLVARARDDPDRRVLTFVNDDGTDEALSVGALHAAARARAHAFARAGVGVNDVVVLAIAPLRQLIETFLGAMYRGAVPTISSLATDRLSGAAQRQRLSALARSCGAGTVVVGSAQRDLDAGGLRVLCCDDLVGTADGSTEVARRAPEDVAFLQYSSGTAGALKGIAHEHGRVLRYLESKRAGSAGLGLTPDDVIVSWLPLYHDLGLISGVLAPLVLGLRAVLLSAQHWVRDPGALLRALHTHRGTTCYMPNFALNHCARSVRDRDLQGIDLGHLKELLVGAEPVRPESLHLFSERFAPCGFRHSALRAGYGMAEMVEGVTVTPSGRPPRIDWIDRAALEGAQQAVPVAAEHGDRVAVVSCGAPMSGAEIRIASASGAPLPERAVGEILIRCEYMFRGYYHQPELTARSIRDGWFRSGDLGYVSDGELYVTGRQTDLIILGGRNLHPEDLEQVADATEGLVPGRSVAFGVADPEIGSDRVVMVCEAAPTADPDQALGVERALRRRVAEQIGVTLGDVRVVERGWVVKTSSGKISRPENRRKYLQAWGDE